MVGGRVEGSEVRANVNHKRAQLSLVLLAVFLHLPALFYPDGASHSSVYNYIWTTQFVEAFASGEFYPRWFPQSFEGLGGPTFYFYPPLTYWVSGSIAASGLSATVANVIAAMMFSAVSGLMMYRWLRPQTPHALLGSLAYMAAPYHLYDFYVRGALAEYASFMWPPLIVMAIRNLRGARSIAALAAAYAGLLITHLPVALLATVFLIVPYGIKTFLDDRRVLIPGLVAGVLGIGLACFYLVPALQLQGAISTDLLWSDYYKPATWFPWNRPYISYLLGIPALALALIVCGAAIRGYWGAATALTAAVSIGLIPFIWDIHLLAQVQFPWRLLGLVEFTAIIALVLKPQMTPLLKLGFAIAILPVTMFSVAAIATLRTPMDMALVENKRPDAPEYLPRGIDKRGITGTQRIPNLDVFAGISRNAAITVTQPGPIVMGRADFPIWQVMHKGREIPHSGPLISFNATEPGVYTIERKTLPSETLGWAVSSLALAILALLWAFARRFDALFARGYDQPVG